MESPGDCKVLKKIGVNNPLEYNTAKAILFSIIMIFEMLLKLLVIESKVEICLQHLMDVLQWC